jgi:hypothetical protein
MRTLVKISIILLLGAFTPAVEKVYVCDSKSSVAYHEKKDCSGLKKCKHEIIYITKTEAQNKGKRPCKICY